LRRFSREQGVTLFATLLAAFKVLLAAYSGQDDIIVGTPIANRNHSELETLIGYFVNLLPLRSRLDEAMTFPELAQAVHQTTIAANEHQELPFGKVVTAVQPPRSPGRNPIFQVELTLLSPEHAPPVLGYGFRSPVEQSVAFGRLTLEPLALESGVSKFDITVLLWDMENEVTGTFEYSTKLFKMTTIEAMVADFGRLLTHLAATPEVRLGVLSDRFTASRDTNQVGRLPRKLKKIGKKNLRRVGKEGNK
jgi:non-ribosomal peptide synthetase component F